MLKIIKILPNTLLMELLKLRAKSKVTKSGSFFINFPNL